MGCTSENAKLTNVLAIVERLLPTRFRFLDDLPCPRLVFFALEAQVVFHKRSRGT